MGQTLGIMGTGAADGQVTRDLLETITDDDTRVIFALTERYWTPTMKGVVEFLVDLMDLDYEVVVDTSSMALKEIAPYIQGAARVHKVQRIAHKVVNLLTKAGDPSLLLLWNDEDAEDMTALERAVDKNIPAFDLTDNLEPLEFNDEPPGIGVANLLAIATPGEDEEYEEEYDEGVLVVMSKDEFVDFLEQAIVNALRRFRTEG